MTAAHQTDATAEDALRRFRSHRDPAALGELFDRTAPGLLRVALSIAPDAALAENALQETFLAVLEAPERWDEARPVMPWLLGILHRQVGKIRRNDSRAPDPLRLAPPLAEDPSERAASREELVRVRTAIDELPEPYRAVAVLRWRHGLEPADIADVRGEPPGTTRSLLSRALEKLRERLGGGAFALFGIRPTRGIAAIRQTLMRKAASAAATGTAAGIGGMLVMKKIAVACVVLLLVGGGTWWAASHILESMDPAKSREEIIQTAVTAPVEAKRVRAVTAVAPLADELPPPVDLENADRDLDLFGRIVDEEDKPVAGAKVTTVRYPWRTVSVLSMERYVEGEDGPATRTARDGTFAVRLVRGAMFDLRIDAEGYSQLTREHCLAGERVTITLRRGALLDVTTVDEAGRPVAGVQVTSYRSDQFDPLRQDREALTDAEGHVALPGLLAGPVLVRLLHPKFAEPNIEIRTIPATGTLRLHAVMVAGRTIHGRVTDAATGAPIAGVSVGTNWTIERAVRTSDDGRYDFPGYTRDILTAVADGYGGRWVKPAASGDVDFALHRGDCVVGRLVRSDGTACIGARVAVYGVGTLDGTSGRDTPTEGPAHVSLSMVTGADGRFELRGLRHEVPHTLIAAAPGSGRTLLDFDPAPDARGTIDLGDVVMHVSRSIEGLATDGAGKVLPETSVVLAGGNDDRVRLRRASIPRDFRMTEVRRTDDLGRFRFVDLAPGIYELHVFTRGVPTPPTTHVTIPPDRDLRDVRVTLAGSETLSVRVIDATGTPVEKVSVSVDGNFGQDEHGNRWPLYDSTDVAGRVSFHGLPRVTVTLSVSDGSKRFAPLRTDPLALEGKEVELCLHRATTLAGFVRDPEGRPVPRHSIKAVLHRDGRDAGYGQSGDDGAFSVEVPSDESIDLRVEGRESVHTKEGFTSRTTDWRGELPAVTGPADGLVLVVRHVTIANDRRLVVVLRDSEAHPMPGVRISAYGNTVNKGKVEVTDAEGRATLEELPAEECRVNVEDTLLNPNRLALDVPPKSISVKPDGQEIVVSYRTGVAIRGRVVDSDDKPVPRTIVDVVTGDYTYYSVTCDADGRFTTAGLVGVGHKITARSLGPHGEMQGTVEGVVPSDTEITIHVAAKLPEPNRR